MPTQVLGVYSEPPPAEMIGVDYVRVGDGRAARAANWISSRLNEAAEVTKFWDPPLPPP